MMTRRNVTFNATMRLGERSALLHVIAYCVLVPPHSPSRIATAAVVHEWILFA